MLTMILMVFAFVCLILAAFNVPTGRINLGWLGMAFWAATLLLRVLNEKRLSIPLRP